jgi:hypothetical protein
VDVEDVLCEPITGMEEPLGLEVEVDAALAVWVAPGGRLAEACWVT